MNWTKPGVSFFARGTLREQWRLALHDPAYLLLWLILIIAFLCAASVVSAQTATEFLQSQPILTKQDTQATPEPITSASMFVVANGDTGRAVTFLDTVVATDIFGNETTAVFTRHRADTLAISATVGDTISLELYAEDWPQAVGYFALVRDGLSVAIPGAPPVSKTMPLDTVDYEIGAFWSVSKLPTSLSGFARVDDASFQIGFQSLGDSGGQGYGSLGIARFRVSVAEDVTLTIASVDIVTLNEALDFEAQTIEIGIVIRLTVQAPPERITADHNGNGVIDFNDFLAFAAHFGTRSVDAGAFDDRFDYTRSGDVGFDDFLLFAAGFGKPPVTFWTRGDVIMGSGFDPADVSGLYC